MCIRDRWNWSGTGTLDGIIVTVSAGTSVALTGSPSLLNSTISNSGAWTISNPAATMSMSGSVFDNTTNGTVSIANDFSFTDGGGAGSTITIAGTISKTGGTGTSNLGVTGHVAYDQTT